jgi:hypothetical protein
MIRFIAILLIGLMLAGASGAADDVMYLAPEDASISALQIDPPTPSTHFLESLGIERPTVFVAQRDCCKICRVGKACGDTCISRDKVCHVGPGCACDG